MSRHLFAVFATCAVIVSGLTVELKPRRQRERQALGNTWLSRNRQLPSDPHRAANPLVRPNAENGVPDYVEFSLMCRAFFGVNFQDGTFSADLVITLAWNDTRAASLVPQGQHSITLPLETFQRTHWEPSAVITSRAIRGTEVLTTAVEVHADGHILLVQRSLATSYNRWDVRRYPFDMQNLTVLVASSNLMLEDLKFVISPNASLGGVRPDAFGSGEYNLVGYDLNVFETIDGALRKSRGRLVIMVKRKPGSFIQTYVIPEMLLLLIAWSVFFFPPLIPFAMPRVATGIFSLLSLMTINTAAMAKLPAVRNGLTWVEAFNKDCLFLMVYTILLNVFVESVNNWWEHKELGKSFLLELQLSYPLVCVLVLGSCAIWPDRWSIESLASSSLYILMLGFLGFLAQAIFRMWRLEQAKARAAAVAAAADAAASPASKPPGSPMAIY